MTKLELSRAWFEKHIRDEGDHDIGAGAIGIIEGIHHVLIEYDRIMAPRPDMLLITPEIRRSILAEMPGPLLCDVRMEKGRLYAIDSTRIIETIDVEKLTPLYRRAYP